MLNILLMIILIIIIIFIIILIMGVRIALNYNKKDDNIEGQLKILILKKIKVYSQTYPAKEKDKKKDKEEKKSRDAKKIFELLKPCFNDLKEFLHSFLNSITIHKLENHLVIGFDSYADTGKYIGMIWGILAIVNNFDKNARLSAEPSFNGSVFNTKGEIDIDISILKLIVPTIRLVSKKEIRTLIRGALNG